MLPKWIYTFCLLTFLQVVTGQLYAQPSVSLETAKQKLRKIIQPCLVNEFFHLAGEHF